MTFSEMLARIGAIIQNLLTLFSIINYFVSYWNCDKHKMNELLNKIYNDTKKYSHYNQILNAQVKKKNNENDISNSKLNINELNKYDSQVRELSNNSKNISFKSKSNNASLIGTIKKSEEELKVKSITIEIIHDLINQVDNCGHIKFSFCNYLYNKYISSSTLFKFINNYYSKSMDVENLERLYFQFNLLKFIMFNNQQLHLFEKIPFLNGTNKIKEINSIKIEENLNIELSDESDYNKKLLLLYSNCHIK